jgi:hypothetical protein
MKKATLQAIYDVLSMHELEGMVSPDVLAELDKEINKGAEEKAARDAVYESVHELVVDNLSSTPITCADLWNEISAEASEDMTRNKLQYALNNLWQDEIEKIPGKPNTYRRK